MCRFATQKRGRHSTWQSRSRFALQGAETDAHPRGSSGCYWPLAGTAQPEISRAELRWTSPRPRALACCLCDRASELGQSVHGRRRSSTNPLLQEEALAVAFWTRAEILRCVGDE